MDYFCKVNGINMETKETHKCKIVDSPHCVPLEKDTSRGNNIKNEFCERRK